MEPRKAQLAIDYAASDDFPKVGAVDILTSYSERIVITLSDKQEVRGLFATYSDNGYFLKSRSGSFDFAGVNAVNVYRINERREVQGQRYTETHVTLTPIGPGVLRFAAVDVQS